MRVNLQEALAACAIVGYAHLAFAAGGPGGPAAGPSLVPAARPTSTRVGSTVVTINVSDTGSDITFIRVHQNEMPAGAVGARINTEVPSRFIDLSQRGSRNVTVSLGDTRYSFDPNRIYSADVAPGARRVGIAPAVQRATRALADDITALLLPNAPVIALHNNRGTLLDSYTSGPFKAFTHGVYVNPLMDSSTFAVVSTNELFDAIRRLGISVVWENRAGANDDGSLLAYAQRRDIPYVNVEGPIGGSAETQLNVVRQIVQMLRASPQVRNGRAALRRPTA